jgi:hypothetical protein
MHSTWSDIEYDCHTPLFVFVEIIGEAGMKGHFDLAGSDGEMYMVGALNFAPYEPGNFTSCDDAMKHVLYGNIKSKVVGAFHDQTAHPGGPESSALVGGATNPFCAAPTVVNTAEGVSQDVHVDAPLSFNSTRGLELVDQVGIRYESDYHRGDPGYTKGFFFDNATPKPTPAGASGSESYGGIEHAPFHLEDMKYPQFGTCEQYKTAKVLAGGTEHAMLLDYIVGSESEGCHVGAHVFGAAAFVTLTAPMVNPDNGAMAYLRVSTCTSALDIRQVTAPR